MSRIRTCSSATAGPRATSGSGTSGRPGISRLLTITPSDERWHAWSSRAPGLR